MDGDVVLRRQLVRGYEGDCVRTSRDGVTWSGPTRGADGGLLYTLGGAYASTAGQVWFAWVQELELSNAQTYAVRHVRASY